MLPEIVHLPNGENLTVKPVFGGISFKINELSVHGATLPPGWTVMIRTVEYDDEEDLPGTPKGEAINGEPSDASSSYRTRPFTRPTLQNDDLFLSSISSPSSQDFKPPVSPTRQIAMMLWATLYWYFHQPEPPLHITNEASKHTPDAGKPRGDWRINIKKEGVFRGRHLLQKLERMGLIYSEDSSVGASLKEGLDGWTDMFVSRRAFWMLSARLFLFTLTPVSTGSPHPSRPSSPVRTGDSQMHQVKSINDATDRPSKSVLSIGLWSGPSTPGPFASGSHLPTYYPPAPAQYIMSNGVRHPLRPKPPRQGEVFYSRYIPSLKQYLSFRAVSLSDKPIAYNGPVPLDPTPTTLSDVQLLHKWMNVPRVAKFWGCSGPISTQEAFLKTNLESRNSFPAIGYWDGKPFGYFEIYWVKEDILGKHLGKGEVGDWDRGIHVLIGEEEYRGKHRIGPWISSLVHWLLLSDYRTDAVVLEPRIDNTRFVEHLQNSGFAREKEVTLPHKQSAFMRLRRENFDGPVL
ncbi:MAG: hypothetical protein M1818_005589 [Claussenomyces sp. TS43310]|nr:MAG: hypothetical protein M1818_005589 [Claussenomyces sp. TS43310]